MRSSTVIIETESDMINSFRFLDHKHLELPDNMRFPLRFDHYLTWSDSTGTHQFLVFRKYGQEELVGMVFDRSDAGQAGRTQMCCWCQTTGSSDLIDMLTVRVNAKTLVGVVLCIDLSCVAKLDTVAKLSKKSPDLLAQEVVGRMSHFYERKFETGH